MRVLLCCTCVLLVTTPVKAFAPLGSPCTGLHTCHPDPVRAGRHDLVTHRRLRDSYSSCHDLRMYECMHACPAQSLIRATHPRTPQPCHTFTGLQGKSWPGRAEGHEAGRDTRCRHPASSCRPWLLSASGGFRGLCFGVPIRFWGPPLYLESGTLNIV